MDWIKQYLITVISVTVIAALLMQLLGKSSKYSPIMRIILGIFLTITVLHPFSDLLIGDINEYISNFEFSAEHAIADGTAWSYSQRRSFITEQAESYIFDKATSLGLTLSAEIQLSESEPPTPDAVILHGDADPYSRQCLQQFIQNDLGIPKEAQKWNP